MAHGVAPQSAASGIIDAPIAAAANAVICGTVGLDAGKAALRAGAACVEPFTVGVEHVLDIVLACRNAVPWSEYVADMIPRFALDAYQIKIPVEVTVSELRVRHLMKERELVFRGFYGSEINRRGRG